MDQLSFIRTNPGESLLWGGKPSALEDRKSGEAFSMMRSEGEQNKQDKETVAKGLKPVSSAIVTPFVRGLGLSENVHTKAPYSEMARNGLINYKGVVFVCDDQKATISLGDMSNEKNVITISLPSGGTLKVNRDSTGDLAKALGMFSLEDRLKIMETISMDGRIRSTLNEMEENETETCEELVENQVSAINEGREEEQKEN